ncbi:hypothetical protein QWY82_08300 [Simiduia curdlanivorans]|uniref:GNAT family N-acetyltransferase n=1 Tax=Simiduia curdlanivorans TaxID=1492769 RepID=A0ABV8V6G2_9GAMM|nr:hypothetical protein [Simiduia curdlanivorans]MDN3638804.1 hypothetical protein [Simiduia curdlanivorans]
MDIIINKQAIRINDQVCSSLRDVKRVLQERPVARLLIAYEIPGRETGLQLLHWAAERNRIPAQVNILEPNLRASKVLSDFLISQGYKSFSARQYVRVKAFGHKAI